MRLEDIQIGGDLISATGQRVRVRSLPRAPTKADLQAIEEWEQEGDPEARLAYGERESHQAVVSVRGLGGVAIVPGAWRFEAAT